MSPLRRIIDRLRGVRREAGLVHSCAMCSEGITFWCKDHKKHAKWRGTRWVQSKSRKGEPIEFYTCKGHSIAK